MNYIEMLDVITITCSKPEFNIINFKKILYDNKILYEDLHDILDILCKKGKYLCVKHMVENVLKEEDIEYTRLICNACHNENECKENLMIIKYLLERTNEKINYNLIFTIACAYDINIVKYLYFKNNRFEDLEDLEILYEGLNNALYNMKLHSNNYLIVKFLVGINENVRLKLKDENYLKKACNYFSMVSHHILDDKLFKYIIKLEPYNVIYFKNYFNYLSENQYIVNRMNEYYINNLKKIQLYFLRILYSPYTKRGKIFLEKQRDKLFET